MIKRDNFCLNTFEIIELHSKQFFANLSISGFIIQGIQELSVMFKNYIELQELCTDVSFFFKVQYN